LPRRKLLRAADPWTPTSGAGREAAGLGEKRKGANASPVFRMACVHALSSLDPRGYAAPPDVSVIL